MDSQTLEPKPSVECAQILSNEALKPSKLQRHLNSKQPEVAKNQKNILREKERVCRDSKES